MKEHILDFAGDMVLEQDARLIKAYLDDKEKVKAFIATYMYILNVGMGDGITESMILESEDLSEYQLDEGLIGNVLNFIKGKTAINKYYKGLYSAAKTYVAASKKIDNMDKDKRAQFRKSEEKKYDDQVKALDDVKKKIDELKKDSKILQKFDSFANNKYKIKLYLTGKKSSISLARLKGYSDDIDKIKAEQTSLEDDIKKAEEEAKAAEEKEKGKEEKKDAPEKTDEPEKKDEPEKSEKDAKREKIQKAIDNMKDNLKGLMKQKAGLIQDEADDAKIKSVDDKINSLKNKIADKEKELKENKTLSLSFFYELNNINEELRCLENLIEESL